MQLRLREGVTAGQAIAALRPLIMEAGNIASAGSTPGGVPALRDAYLTWVEAVERQLTSLTRDRVVNGMLQSPRYWHIRQIQRRMDARPAPLVEAEVALQRGALEDLVADLQARVDRLSATGGRSPCSTPTSCCNTTSRRRCRGATCWVSSPCG
jgi:hypothetical protein